MFHYHVCRSSYLKVYERVGEVECWDMVVRGELALFVATVEVWPPILVRGLVNRPALRVPLDNNQSAQNSDVSPEPICIGRRHISLASVMPKLASRILASQPFS